MFAWKCSRQLTDHIQMLRLSPSNAPCLPSGHGMCVSARRLWALGRVGIFLAFGVRVCYTYEVACSHSVIAGTLIYPRCRGAHPVDPPQVPIVCTPWHVCLEVLLATHRLDTPPATNTATKHQILYHTIQPNRNKSATKALPPSRQQASASMPTASKSMVRGTRYQVPTTK